MTPRRGSRSGVERRTLCIGLAVFFVALATPAGVLVHQAYRQLKAETFYQYRGLAEELAARIDAQFVRRLEEEEERTFADYAFLNVAGAPAANFLQRSPLSVFPVVAVMPGWMGYFQVDAGGAFSTPLLPPEGTDPARYGIAAAERAQRFELQERIARILGANRLVATRETGAGAAGQTAPALEPRAARAPRGGVSRDTPVAASEIDAPAERAAKASSQAAFDLLAEQAAPRLQTAPPAVDALGRAGDRANTAPRMARLEDDQSPGAPVEKKRARKERGVLPDTGALAFAEAPGAPPILEAQRAPRVHIFESEIDPFTFSLLESGHGVLFRKVWRDGQRYIQGALIDTPVLLRDAVGGAFRGTALARMSDLHVAYRGEVLAVFPGAVPRASTPAAGEPEGALLHRARLSAPFGDLEMTFRVTRLPRGPGAGVILWTAAGLSLVLSGGCWAMYRLGLRQIALARQQQDFVSAVSHELKTPLTSIRMYAEILRAGWATEDRKRVYYDYIHDESERLSRLIANVLQLARMTRSGTRAELRPVPAGELLDTVRPKIAAQIERAGFALEIVCDPEAGRAVIAVDADGFSQILINLVDNAVKFSAQAARRVIDVGCCRSGAARVRFSVRDHGPGIPGDQLQKIFSLFYRSANAPTRAVAGTGIGLALARQLALGMGASIAVVNRDPGAEFRLEFEVLRAAPAKDQGDT